ncbi:MAG: arginine--tRNA ligase [Candidatus Moranbacteria bacterium]|jgi:arginyl-tRNA synthetase|nr:arginine--tRNA ligase [Candidatus Moranbacteria bacterium]
MKKELEKKIQKAVKDLFGLEQTGFVVDYPKDEKFGDYATNVAMVLVSILKKSPMEIAEEIKTQILKCKMTDKNVKFLEKVEVVKPGYINFYLSSEYFQNKVREINEKKEEYGNSKIGDKKKFLIEFVSANPTGPIHLGNARGGPLGDALANVLKKSNHQVEREYYVNDFGNQVLMLGHSILKDEETQYRGDYVDDLASQKSEKMNDPMEVGNWGANVILEKFIKPTCEKLGVNFDIWFSEKSLHTNGKVDEAVDLLRECDLIYEKDGAIWFKSTQFGDDKDRVLIKSNGFKTYSATDFAYHKNKIERGFDKLINIQGADHHKQAEVVKSFVENFLHKKGKLDLIMTQIVRVIKDGKEIKMSKRKGIYFALDDLLEEVGKDAVRFIFTSYAPTSHINFDLNLALERSEKNPVFYVQYAHARICSILRKMEEAESGERIKNRKAVDLSLLVHKKEISLIREMGKFPELIEEISKNYEVHKLPHYAVSLADKFHSFYAVCKVNDEKKPELSLARQELVKAVRIVLSETLRLVGVSAPESM